MSDQTLLQVGSHARTSVLLAKEAGSKVNDQDCGGSLHASYAYFDPDTWLLRMSQGSLFPSHPDDPYPLDVFLESLPASGLMRNGRLYPQDPWEVPSSGDVYSSSPTLRATEVDQGDYQRDNGQVGKERLTLKGLVKSLETTPTLNAASADKGPRKVATKAENGGHQVNLVDLTAHLSGRGGGVLNPRWSEWYMGFPVGWCEVPSEDLETP